MQRSTEAFEQPQDGRAGAARADRLDHQLRTHVLICRGGQKERARGRSDLDSREVEAFVTRILKSGLREQIDQRIGAGKRARYALRPDDAGRGGHDAVRRVARLARGLGGDERRIANQIDLGGDRDIEQRTVVLIRNIVDQRQREVGLERLLGEVENGKAMDARDLRVRVHLRGARAVLHGLAQEHGAHLLPELGDLGIVGRHCRDHRKVELGRQPQALVVAEPGLEREVALGREIRLDPVQRHHCGQRPRDVGDVGDHGALGRADRVAAA